MPAAMESATYKQAAEHLNALTKCINLRGILKILHKEVGLTRSSAGCDAMTHSYLYVRIWTASLRPNFFTRMSFVANETFWLGYVSNDKPNTYWLGLTAREYAQEVAQLYKELLAHEVDECMMIGAAFVNEPHHPK